MWLVSGQKCNGQVQNWFPQRLPLILKRTSGFGPNVRTTHPIIVQPFHSKVKCWCHGCARWKVSRSPVIGFIPWRPGISAQIFVAVCSIWDITDRKPDRHAIPQSTVSMANQYGVVNMMLVSVQLHHTVKTLPTKPQDSTNVCDLKKIRVVIQQP